MNSIGQCVSFGYTSVVELTKKLPVIEPSSSTPLDCKNSAPGYFDSMKISSHIQSLFV